MITVSVIEESRELRNLLEAEIGRASGLKCVSAYSGCAKALKYLRSDKPDVILMDVESAGKIRGTDAIRRIKKQLPEAKILILSNVTGYLTILASFRSGASGYIDKGEPMENILLSIKEAHNDGNPWCAAARKEITRMLQNHPAPDNLTPCENKVYDLLLEGFSTKEIFSSLGISKSDVKFHLGNIYVKMKVRNRVEAIIKGRNGRAL